MVIGLDDVLRAAEWLYEAEATMPLVFKNMAGASDELVLSEALFEMRARFKETGYPISVPELRSYFSTRVKGHLVEHMLSLSVKRGDYKFENGVLIPN